MATGEYNDRFVPSNGGVLDFDFDVNADTVDDFGCAFEFNAVGVVGDNNSNIDRGFILSFEVVALFIIVCLAALVSLE